MKLKWTILLLGLFRLSGLAQVPENKIQVSDDIHLLQLSPKAYVHVSVSEIKGFGKVSSNGLIIIDEGKAFLFDTPVTNEQTETLVAFLNDSLHTSVIGFVPNHWHKDCMGGLEYLNKQNIKSYANQLTIQVAKEHELVAPQEAFKDSLLLKLNHTKISCYFLGAAHSPDNIIVWIPSAKILFAGCMVKDLDSTGLGNLAEADLKTWPSTIQKVIDKFPSAKIVIPGHGRIGGRELLMHTQELLLKEKKVDVVKK